MDTYDYLVFGGVVAFTSFLAYLDIRRRKKIENYNRRMVQEEIAELQARGDIVEVNRLVKRNISGNGSEKGLSERL